METVITETAIRDIYRENDPKTQDVLRRIFGSDVFTNERPIGVWCVDSPDYRKHELIPFDKWDTEKHLNPECVAVVTEDAAFLISLYNTVVAQWGQPSDSAKLITDIESLDSKAATDAVIAANRGLIYSDPDGDEEYNFVGSPAADFCRKYGTANIRPGKWDLPTVKQLKIMHQHRKEINKCLLAMGAPTLVMGYYWSSIAVKDDEWCAWIVILNYGNTNNYYRINGSYVRAVSAFQNLCLNI